MILKFATGATAPFEVNNITLTAPAKYRSVQCILEGNLTLICAKMLLRFLQELFRIESDTTSWGVPLLVIGIFPAFVPEVHDTVPDTVEAIDDSHLPFRNQMTIDALHDIRSIMSVPKSSEKWRCPC
jgi:hypothetical protein